MISKYRNRITVVDGIKFASMAEGNRFRQLRLLEKAGEIQNLLRQVRFVVGRLVDIHGVTYTNLSYIADFTYTERGGDQVVEDVKGYETIEFKRKEKLFKRSYPNHVFRKIQAKDCY